MLKVNAFGYELLKETVLTQILGEDSPEILYWIGKQVARNNSLTTMEEIINFFDRANWGTLTLTKEKKSEMTFSLSSDLITNRLDQKISAHFQLEAGFLAQQMEYINGCVTECYEEPKKRNHVVTFTVKWDEKDRIVKEEVTTDTNV